MVENEIKTSNIQAEICFIGSLFSEPDLYVTYGNFMRPKYDFVDEATRFFYDSFETYYLTFSQTLDETKMNVFMSQNDERFKRYKQYHGWKTIQQYIKLADKNDCKNYFNTVKKYSLIREYSRNGFPVEKILNHKKFDQLTANDIYRIIRVKADKIHTVINSGDEAVNLTEKNEALVNKHLTKPAFGLPFPWPMYNEYFLGMRMCKVIFEGFLSNEGKTRKLMLLSAYMALVQHQKVLFMSNEMCEEDLRNCLLTTVINNKEFQRLHGVKRNKPEKEIVLGVYHDNDGEIIRRKINNEGIYSETDDEYIRRIQDSSKEYWDIIKVSQWIDNNQHGQVLFKDISNDYGNERIEFELRKAKAVDNITYYVYDTLKGYKTDDWSQIKQFATDLKELTNELKMSGFAVYQLSDDTVFTDVFSLSSNNIANAKQIKHVTDILTIGKRIDKSDYHKYQYVAEVDAWGEPVVLNLDYKKDYLAVKIDKNRAGGKDKMILFEINLDFNTWVNIGYLIKREKER